MGNQNNSPQILQLGINQLAYSQFNQFQAYQVPTPYANMQSQLVPAVYGHHLQCGTPLPVNAHRQWCQPVLAVSDHHLQCEKLLAVNAHRLQCQSELEVTFHRLQRQTLQPSPRR